MDKAADTFANMHTGQSSPKKSKFTMDKKYTKLAAESPLDFIEQVLANHPQPN